MTFCKYLSLFILIAFISCSKQEEEINMTVPKIEYSEIEKFNNKWNDVDGVTKLRLVVHQFSSEDSFYTESQVLALVDSINTTLTQALPNQDIEKGFEGVYQIPKIVFLFDTTEFAAMTTTKLTTDLEDSVAGAFVRQQHQDIDGSKYVNFFLIPYTDSDGFGHTRIAGSDGANDMIKGGIYVYGKTLDKGIISTTFIHELGHYLGLYHTFGKTYPSEIDCDKMKNYIENGINELIYERDGVQFYANDYDDEIDDTPYMFVMGYRPCNDLFGPPHNNNFMNYSVIKNMFTQGQCDKMNAVLKSESRRGVIIE
ncbi:M43 family zinc metalloprotease [Flammeovirga kamogawensis]|uniref:Peptidase M43 pregnancy-associated plasma-A domain-containing protein n=1 Tax=Flammeovirga kamogawensis TaxID=373891 RepID=A0ABX8H3H2_9BACT|nr:M43 family zinc metalloprotease [Flammeovirga kamogawensis]MBB6460398.1 hypothetical protein [Flammeovirga kamogawensis]QWG10204.1 hypothetical protein KM029_21210 [Flammeovirga kamogawensis]TRX64656.1 hypothetical protein EO216_19140 [Flammeovirga kamogawensis]